MIKDHIKVNELIDSSIFLGMHSVNEKTRIPCKNYFVERLKMSVGMSLEHVGGCDNIIWLYSRKLQDTYYPFMDTLHTVMQIDRLPYEEDHIKLSLVDMQLQTIPMYDRLLIAFAKSCNIVIYTVNNKLLSRGNLPVCRPIINAEKKFPDFLECLYQESLKLRLPDSQITSDYYINTYN